MPDEEFISQHEKTRTKLRAFLIFTTMILVIGFFSWMMHDIAQLKNHISELNKENRELQVRIEAQYRITKHDHVLADKLIDLKQHIDDLDKCHNHRFLDLKMIMRSYSLCGEACRGDEVLEALRKDKRAILEEEKLKTQ